MGLIGKLFKSGKREEKLTLAPEASNTTPKAPRHRSGAPRTRKQIRGRRKAMLGRKVRVQQSMKVRKP